MVFVGISILGENLYINNGKFPCRFSFSSARRATRRTVTQGATLLHKPLHNRYTRGYATPTTMSEKRESDRERAPPARLGAPLSTGSAPLYIGDAVSAPCAGYKGVYCGIVKSINLAEKTLHIEFDDGDVDYAVKMTARVRHAAGAAATLPKKLGVGGVPMRPKAKKMRLPRRKSAPKEKMWSHNGFSRILIAPPYPDRDVYDDLQHRCSLTYRWLWEDEELPEVYPQDRISTVTLHQIINGEGPAYVTGLHVTALRHFVLDLAAAPPMAPAALKYLCGEYDPAEH